LPKKDNIPNSEKMKFLKSVKATNISNFTNMRETDKMAISLPNAGDALGTIGSIIDALREYFKEGYIFVPGKGWKKEVGGLLLDDGTAPSFDFISYDRQTCCDADIGGRGVKIGFTADASDVGSNPFTNNSGVKSVTVQSVTMNGNQPSFTPIPSATWNLSDSESDSSEDGKVRHHFEMCIPCNSIQNKQVNLLITVTDNDGNELIIPFTMPTANNLNCC
jgi:hypothetical protein